MKLGKSFVTYFKDREQAKIVDEIYGKKITVDEIHSFETTDEETGELSRKVVFTVAEDNEHYFYMPDSFANNISDEDIDMINDGRDTISGTFTKITTKKGFQCWNFEDVE